MLKTFETLDELMNAVTADKAITGAGAFTANRYPVRFVLFDNFKDQYDFIFRMADRAQKFPIDKWMDDDYNDVILTHSRLADLVTCLPRNVMGMDLIVTPFSEIARFYDNDKLKEFNALIATIKGVENSHDDVAAHRRLYIPIVGLEGKMTHFATDNQAIIWHLKGSDNTLSYRLIMTNGTTYGVRNLQSKYKVVENVRQWLTIWQHEGLTNTIICTSPALYANAKNAQPDNAFTYCECSSARDFLVKGLHLPLGFITYNPDEEPFWKLLAKEIDIAKDFNFDAFFNQKFDIYDLANYGVFIKTWFEFSKHYMRWLLSAYYRHRFCERGYICHVLGNIKGFTDSAFVEELLTCIFNCNGVQDLMDERRQALAAAAEKGVAVRKEVQEYVCGKIETIAKDKGYIEALKYITITTAVERHLLIRWVGSGAVTIGKIKELYPDLFAYLQPMDYGEPWMEDYIHAYRMAKIANAYTDEVKEMIATINADTVTFYKWYNSLKTTTTLLDGRGDIEVFYWIDGLGIDWMPFVRQVVESKKDDGYFLNEVLIGKALLPTVTSVNRESLVKLTEHLEKTGDIDSAAHKHRAYPDYLIEDMTIVKAAVLRILKNNPGRKIAIVSDHGMTYLSQQVEGKSLAGYESDHSGRLAHKKSGTANSDSRYVVLDDGQTICALRHEALIGKFPEGYGGHGGCTPEEVLVPVFIISNHEETRGWTVVLKTLEVSTANPHVVFTITGLKEGERPFITYNDMRYVLSREEGSTFRSDALTLKAEVTKVTLHVGAFSEDFNIKIKTGVEENDLFSDF